MLAEPIRGLAWAYAAIDEVANYAPPDVSHRLSLWLTAWKEIAVAHEAAIYCKPGAAPKQAVPVDQTQAEIVQRDPQPDTVRVGLPGYGSRVVPRLNHEAAIQAALEAYAAPRRSPPRFEDLSAEHDDCPF